MFKRSLTRLSIALLATCALLALPALADSQARIVRLSDVQGSVQIDKNSGLGFENAFLNLPVTQGTQVRTGNNGRCEVEFEDGSTLRLAPDTLVEFNTLGLSDAGKRTSQVNLVEGMAYVNWLGKDDFTLNFAREVAVLDRGAHFRADVSADVANLAVFKGEVPLEGPSGKLVVEKKKTVTFNAADDEKYTLADKIVEAPLDSWDKESISYHDQYAKDNSSPYGYGASDLNYYGAYNNVPGYGMMWQPYFTGIGWDPFMDGAWGWYPGFGYMFASAYPWGWLPYRYGNWMFVPGFGWMWQPGGWNTWMAVPRYTPTTLVHVNAPVAPAAGSVKTVVVGKAATMSSFRYRYTVSAGSAGLGIARGSLTNLSHLNHQVAKTGFAEVRPAPQFSASSPSGRSAGFSEPHSSMGAPSMGHASSASHASGGTSKH
jgi:Family of unknown function (DUF6600)/FecR protein